jgi:CDP-diacylglycerol--glycerol-3-phosphate 3-phosphatidyltransferase
MSEQPTESGKVSIWNVPNILTMIRIVMVPIFAVMLLTHPDDQGWRLATTGVFTLAILTDLADGRIARKYDLVTDFGKLWDPAADKALTGMAFIGLSILGELWWWVTIVILVREWGITLLRAVIKKYGVMPANRGGKAKTAVQSVALIMYLLYLPAFPMWFQWIAWGMMGLAFVLTVVTGLDYLREAAKLRRNYLQTHEEGGQ